MALDFPSLSEIPLQNPANEFSPTSTPKSSTNGLTYIWNGQSWDLKIVDNSGGGGGGMIALNIAVLLLMGLCSLKVFCFLL